jgi:hypothetical protein
MTRPVAGDEVLAWFKNHRQPWPSSAHCDAIADRINRIAAGPWTDEEYDAAIDAEIAKFYAAAGVQRPPPAPEADVREYWDFNEVTAAAKTLLAAIPNMRDHWTRLEWAPETRGGTSAMDTLAEALTIAMPLIEWPFGRYERVSGQKKNKDWHFHALALAPLILRAMQNAGHQRLSLERNSIAVKILQQALNRASDRIVGIDEPAIAQFLKRWKGWRGLTTKQIADLCCLEAA